MIHKKFVYATDFVDLNRILEDKEYEIDPIYIEMHPELITKQSGLFRLRKIKDVEEFNKSYFDRYFLIQNADDFDEIRKLGFFVNTSFIRLHPELLVPPFGIILFTKLIENTPQDTIEINSQ
jgi:hypothetical protein